MSRLSIFLLASLTIDSCEIHLALAHTTAVSANDFLNSIGVVSTVSRRGEDLTSTIKAAPDYIPRLAATYLHNLTTILANNSSVPTPGNLNYSIPGQPVTVHDLLLQKSDGKFELLVWDKRLSGSDNVTVNLGATLASVTIYDPTIGVSTIQSLSNHPVIIEISHKVDRSALMTAIARRNPV